jgi:recombination protein RecA
MAVKRRRVKVRGVADAAPPSTGGIKKRSSASIAAIMPEPEIPEFGGELGQVINALSASGNYGKPFIKASSRRMDRGHYRTGILALDLCLGGGWRQSSAGMLYGEKSSGKSTTAMQTIAAIQREYPDAMAGWVDIEGTLDKKWAQKLGVDLDRLVVAEPETGEHAVDLADALVRAREVRIVVTDSIAMITPMKEIDDSAEQDTMGGNSKLIGRYIRKTTNALMKERARGHLPILLHINQFRMKVGLVFGDPRSLPGGKALEYSTTQQVEIKNKEIKGKDTDGNEVVLHNEHGAKITKNKGGGPMKEAAFKLNRTAGNEDLPEAFVNQAKTIYKMGTQCGVVTGAPSSYEVEGITGKFRGAPAFNVWALENEVSYNRLQQEIIDRFRVRWDV